MISNGFLPDEMTYSDNGEESLTGNNDRDDHKRVIERCAILRRRGGGGDLNGTRYLHNRSICEGVKDDSGHVSFRL